MKFNNITFTKKMRKQALEKIMHRIDTYFIENDINTTKFYATRTLASGDVAIQTTSIKKAKKLRKKDD